MEILHKNVLNILSIMCPYKNVFTRCVKKKWLTQEIYVLIRERKCLVKRYNMGKDQNLLMDIRRLRNNINACIENEKSEYIKNILGRTKGNPKKFWRTIKSLYEDTDPSDTYVPFKNQESGCVLDNTTAPDYVNNFFANIAGKVCNPVDARPYVTGDRIDNMFLSLHENWDLLNFT